MSFELYFVGVFKDLRDKDDGTEDKTTAACCLRTPIEPTSAAVEVGRSH